MYRNIALLCVFALLCACTLSQYNESGLFGLFPENYVNPKTGFTLWMPKNMHAEQGMYPFVVQRYMDYCEHGNYIGGSYNRNGDVYKEMPDGTRLYAYYYYYTDEIEVGVDAPAFNLTPTLMKINYRVVFNFYVNKQNKITRCKFKQIEGGTSTY